MDIWQGIETEYAVPLSADSDCANHVHEMIDALFRQGRRGQGYLLGTPKGVPLQFLRNGGKAHADHLPGHDIFEISTPECWGARQVVLYERASDALVRYACDGISQGEKRFHVYKTSIAYSSKDKASYTTRGFHESYLVPGDLLERLISLIVPFLAVRSLFCGSGGYVLGKFMISPRQFFLGKVLSKETSKDWPMISLEKDSHTAYGQTRFHVSCGEGLRCELGMFLRQGVTSGLIRCIEEGLLKDVPKLKDPVATAKAIAQDVSGEWRVELSDGSQVDGVRFLEEYYLGPLVELARRTGPTSEISLVVQKFKEVLSELNARDFEVLARKLDWALKLDIIERNLEEYFEVEGDPREVRENLDFQMKAITDTTYDELETELGIERVTRDEEIQVAMESPPTDSRGALRTELAATFHSLLEDIGWDYVVLNGKKFRFFQLDGWNGDRRSKEMVKIQRHLSSEEVL